MPTKILLADDSMTAQKMGKEILTAAGYEVVAVSNGAAAAKKLGDKYGVIILDINMPGYTGFELCEKVRANMDIAKTPVILTSGKMEHYEPTEVQRVKADGVIIKPFEATDLVATVRKMIEKSTAAPAEKDYEKTVMFKASEVQEFKDQSYNDWKSESEEPPPPPKATLDMTHAEASAPAFGMDMDMAPAEEIAPAPIMESAPPAPAFEAAAFSTPPAMDFDMGGASALTPMESAKVEELLQPAPMMEAAAAIPIAPPTFSAGSGRDPNLDTPALEEEPPAAYAIPHKDPALAERVEMASSEFVTRVNQDAPTAEAALVSDDDFEKRVAAAMSSYESPQEIVEAIEPEPEHEPVVEGAPAPAIAAAVAQAAPVADALTIAPSFDAPMAEPPDYERTVKLPVRPELDMQTETAPEVQAAPMSFAEANPMVADPMLETAPVVETAPEAPHMDAALVEQMHAAVAEMPHDTTPHVVEEPIAQAAPAIEIAPPASAATSGHDLELANALAAAVGGEASSMAAAASASPAPNVTVADPNVIAAAVHRAMAKMMPAIMTEVIKELDPEKK